MRKWLAVGVGLLLSAGVTFAQSSGDLFSQLGTAGTAYRSAYSAYVAAKNQHQQYQTAATRVAAIAKANALVVQRHGWLVAYLKFLRAALAEATNIANYPQTVTYLDLETQINQLVSQSSALGQADNFGQVNSQAAEWEKQLEPIDRLAAAARLQIASAQLADFQLRLAGFVAQYQDQSASPSASQKSTLKLITTRLEQSVRAREDTDSQLANYKSGYWAQSSLQQNLVASHDSLGEAAKLLLELTRRQ